MLFVLNGFQQCWNRKVNAARLYVFMSKENIENSSFYFNEWNSNYSAAGKYDSLRDMPVITKGTKTKHR